MPVFSHNIDDYIGYVADLFMEKYEKEFGEYPDNWWES